MTRDDQKKCAEIWEEISKEKTTPEQWCDGAGDALAALIADVMSCSDAFSYVPAPSGSRPGYMWFVGYAYHVIKNQYLTGGYTYNTCEKVRYSQHRSHVNISLTFCN